MKEITRSLGKETVLGKETNLEGKISFETALRMKGRFSGEVNATGDLTVEETAVVKANVKVNNLELDGSMVGNAHVKYHLDLGEKSSLIGDVTTEVLRMSQGAVLRGRVSMLKDAEAIDIFTTGPEQLKKLIADR